MSASTEALKHKFIVDAQRIAGMDLDNAELLAEFVLSLGEGVLEHIAPAMETYKARVYDKVRDEVVDEIFKDFVDHAGSIIWTKNSILNRIASHTTERRKQRATFIPAQRS